MIFAVSPLKIAIKKEQKKDPQVTDQEWKDRLFSMKKYEDVRALSMPDIRILISKLTVWCFFKQRYGNKKRKLSNNDSM